MLGRKQLTEKVSTLEQKVEKLSEKVNSFQALIWTIRAEQEGYTRGTPKKPSMWVNTLHDDYRFCLDDGTIIVAPAYTNIYYWDRIVAHKRVTIKDAK